MDFRGIVKPSLDQTSCLAALSKIDHSENLPNTSKTIEYPDGSENNNMITTSTIRRAGELPLNNGYRCL